MKYTKEFYQLLGHINPAMYDAIFPMNPLLHLSADPGTGTTGVSIEAKNYRSPGSVFGTDYSGDLTVLAKLSWRMSALVQKMQTALAFAKIAPRQASQKDGAGPFLAGIIDEYCGNGIIRFPFPPKPRGIEGTLTIEEKVGAAMVFAHAAASVEGSDLAMMLSEGADKIFDSAIAQIAETKTRAGQSAIAQIAINSEKTIGN